MHSRRNARLCLVYFPGWQQPLVDRPGQPGTGTVQDKSKNQPMSLPSSLVFEVLTEVVAVF